jgi:cytochrome b561
MQPRTPGRSGAGPLSPPRSVLTTRALPFATLLLSLIVAAFLVDFVLHRLDLGWLGRELGWVGTLLILASFLYSLRKRRWIEVGSAKGWLRLHEILAWTGALTILVHAGIHLHALLPWAALLAMMIAVASGVTGRSLLIGGRRQLAGRQKELRERGLSEEEIERLLFFDSLTVRTMEQWRTIHVPLTLNFAVLSLVHVATALLFG